MARVDQLRGGVMSTPAKTKTARSPARWPASIYQGPIASATSSTSTSTPPDLHGQYFRQQAQARTLPACLHCRTAKRGRKERIALDTMQDRPSARRAQAQIPTPPKAVATTRSSEIHREPGIGRNPTRDVPLKELAVLSRSTAGQYPWEEAKDVAYT
jgi:hypothetical protein